MVETVLISPREAAILQRDWVNLGRLPIWVVTWSPKEMPGSACARPQFADLDNDRLRVSSACLVADSVEAIRALLPKGLHQTPRFADDAPAVVEVWL
jgi:hypothetical protein